MLEAMAAVAEQEQVIRIMPAALRPRHPMVEVVGSRLDEVPTTPLAGMLTSLPNL